MTGTARVSHAASGMRAGAGVTERLLARSLRRLLTWGPAADGRVVLIGAVATYLGAIAAGRIAPFSGVTELAPGVTAVPTPGHTPGHSFFRVESQGKSVTFIGDIVHVQAVQFPKPEITITYDVDNDAARRQRLVQFRRLAQEGVVVAPVRAESAGEEIRNDETRRF